MTRLVQIEAQSRAPAKNGHGAGSRSATRPAGSRAGFADPLVTAAQARLRLLRRLVLHFLLERLPDGLESHESLFVRGQLARRVEGRLAVGNLGHGFLLAHGSPSSSFGQNCSLEQLKPAWARCRAPPGLD